MLRILILIQLSIWVTTIHAFFPWFPGCPEDAACDHQSSRRSSVGEVLPVTAERVETRRRGIAFKLSQRAGDINGPLERRVARAAQRASRKYSRTSGSKTVLDRSPDSVKRDNKFSVVTAATPSATNAVGLNQDGSDISYFIQVGFGSNPKPLYMLLDTGAGTTWVMGSLCTTAACAIHNSYGPDDSKTLQSSTTPFSIAYGSGTVAGMTGTDSLSLAGFKTTMSFGIANSTSDDFTHFPFDGILGLSLAKSQTDNFMQTVKSQKSLPANLFAVSLSRNSDGSNAGEVMFGATNPAKFTGDIAYTAVSDKGGGDWSIPMDDIMYDGNKAGVTGKLAYIDTGTTYVFGPPGDVATLYKQVPGATSKDGVSYTVPCSSNKPLGVSFSGVTYSISAKDWLSPPNAAGDCTGNIYGHEAVQGAWLLGDLFLKNVYAVFDADQSRIGFASRPPPPSPTTANLSGPTTPVTSVVSGVTTVITPQPLPVTASGSSFPGLSGHETAGTAVADSTAGPTATHTSPGEQLEGNKYVSIIVIAAAIAMAV